MPQKFYDLFSDDYDRFVDWPARLAAELPFLQAQLAQAPTHPGRRSSFLDAACGTGMHALALHAKDFAASGADLSSGMIARARLNAGSHSEVRFEVAGFGELAQAFASQLPFQAVLCLGNSLPHLLDAASLTTALLDFGACLEPGGLLVLQSLNYDRVMATRQRFMDPSFHHEGGVTGHDGPSREWIFLRFYDFDPTGLITFNVITLQRQMGEDWEQRIVTTRLRPLPEAELSAALQAAGFEQLRRYGSLQGEPFDQAASPNLVIVGRKA